MQRPTLQPARRRVSRQRGLTLLELVLALGGTAFLGLAIASMLSAVAYGNQTADGLQALGIRQQLVAGRLGNAIREARQIVKHTPTELVLWYDDLNGNGTLDSTELMWIRYDAAAQEVTMERPDMSASGIFGLPAEPGGTTNYDILRWGFSFVNWLEEQRWSRGTTACDFAINDADATLATLATVTITFEENGQTDTMVSSFKLRN